MQMDEIPEHAAAVKSVKKCQKVSKARNASKIPRGSTRVRIVPAAALHCTKFSMRAYDLSATSTGPKLMSEKFVLI